MLYDAYEEWRSRYEKNRALFTEQEGLATKYKGLWKDNEKTVKFLDETVGACVMCVRREKDVSGERKEGGGRRTGMGEN